MLQLKRSRSNNSGMFVCEGLLAVGAASFLQKQLINSSSFLNPSSPTLFLPFLLFVFFDGAGRDLFKSVPLLRGRKSRTKVSDPLRPTEEKPPHPPDPQFRKRAALLKTIQKSINKIVF